MASNKDRIPTDNKSSIALLRRLRAGGDDVHFVHRIDVCAAPHEALVADLDPVPGTGLDDDGFSRIWYLYHAKKYMNSRGDTSGHRKRAVTDGGGTAWHSETSRKDVQGSNGGTFCTFSYGRKIGSSAKSIVRMGWCMTEYDLAATDEQQDAAAAASNYVLCKVYRSPRAKEKPASASSSTSSKKASSKQTAKKRKAGGGDHPEAPPAKLIQQPEYVQQQPDFDFNIEDINFYLDYESMFRDELEPILQQPIAEPEHDGRFIQLPCGPVLAAESGTVRDMLGPDTTAVKPQRGVESEHEHGNKGLNMEESFTVEQLLRSEPPQPIVAPPPGRAGNFIQMPFGPVVAEATVDGMLGFVPETMYGQWSGGMTRASIPWSSYAPTSSLYTGRNSLLQGPADPLRLPYLTC